MDDCTNHQRRLWKPALRWGSCSFVLFASVLLCPKSGLSLTENHASPLNSSNVIVVQSGLSQKADHLFQEASRLYDKGTEESLRQAIELWKQAQQLYQSDRNKVGEAKALHWIGSAYYSLGDWQQSLHANEQALPLVETVIDQGQSDRLYVAAVLYQMGEASIKLGLWEQAIQHYSKAKQLFASLYHSDYERTWNEQSMVYWQARASQRIGLAYRWLRNYEQSIDSYQKAYVLFSIVAVKQDHTRSDVVQIIGEPGKSEIGKVHTLYQLSSIFEELGRFERSLESYQKALPILQNLCRQRSNSCDQDMVVQLLTDISRAFYELGDSISGERYLNQARQLLSTVKDQQNAAKIHSTIGYILSKSSRLEESLHYLNKTTSYYIKEQDWLNAGRTRIMIAHINSDLGLLSKYQLIDYYKTQVLPLMHKAKDNDGIAAAYESLGTIYVELDPKQALTFFSKAQEVWKKIGRLDTLADNYFGTVRAYLRLNNLPKALEAVNNAITTVEYLRNTIDSRNLRASYFSIVQSYYEAKIHILVRLSQQAPSYSKRLSCELEAFDVSEQTRSRTLLGLLTRSRFELNLEKIKPNSRDEVNRLQLALRDAEKKLDGATSPEELAKLEQQYIELSRQLDSLVDGSLYQPSGDNIAIKDSSPRSLSDSDCLSDDKANSSKRKSIYVGVVPNNEPLLQYYLGGSASYLFVASKSQDDESIVFGFKVYPLPGRKEIEAAAEKFYKRLKNVDPSEKIAQAGECLRQKILPREFLDTYKKERLIISADGVLHNIPFAALPLPNAQEKSSPNTADSDACKEPSSSKRFQNYVPLVTQHEIINVPSISSIYAIRQRSSKLAPKALAILADPRFDDVTKRSDRSECPSLRNGSQEGANRSNSNRDLTSDVETALRSAGGVRKQLPCTRIEADKILSEVNEPSQTLSAFNTDATQQWVMQPALSQYRILHFATHGFASDSQPELSGLVLSRFNRQGQPIEDYFLRLNEIFNLRLSAELVVLSACETGLGKNLRGEGIIGLTRGFMSAGAKRVVASLWNVGDRSTAELMAKFYHRMLKEGLSPSAALQQTQIEMWRAKRNPNKWAAFAFYGEWEK